MALLALLVVACSSGPGATTSPVVFPPLPPGIVIAPGPDAPSATISASSQAGAEVGVRYRYELGHCGLGSPFDFDGSLWDPAGAFDRAGGPVDADGEIGELLNATSGEIILVTPEAAQFRTPSGTVVGLDRHEGEKAYSLCD